jgi:O-antigen/teichoic acid export membrane protein
VGELRRLGIGASTEVLRDPIYPEVKGYWQGASVSNVFLVAIEQLDKPILAAVAAFEKVAVFHVAGRLALFARRLIYVPFQVMNPEITHKWESGRRQELTADMELFTKLALGLGLGMVVFLGVFAKPLLLLTSNSEFLSGAPVLWVFTAVLPFLCLYQPLVMFLRATGRVWYAFVGDAGWLLAYLGTAVLLVKPFGLPGYVSGQIVASILVFAWVLIAFHKLRLPRPPTRFYLARVGLGLGVWLVSMLAGRFLPPWPWWAYGLLFGALGVLGNFLLVRGGFLSRAEADRTIALLAGRGTAGKLGRFLFAWPHGVGRP